MLGQKRARSRLSRCVLHCFRESAGHRSESWVGGRASANGEKLCRAAEICGASPNQYRRAFTLVLEEGGIGASALEAAQEIDQNTRQQIERIAAAYVENWNKHDAAGVAALYAKDGVQVTATGVRSGPQEIEQAYQSAIKTFPQHNGQTIEQISPLGSDAVIRIGQFHLAGEGQNGPTKLDGRYTSVYVREGGTWKIRILTAIPIPPPTQAAGR